MTASVCRFFFLIRALYIDFDFDLDYTPFVHAVFYMCSLLWNVCLIEFIYFSIDIYVSKDTISMVDKLKFHFRILSFFIKYDLIRKKIEIFTFSLIYQTNKTIENNI